MPNKVAELHVRNQAVVAELPGMRASEKFALLESLERDRQGAKSPGEAEAIMDLFRIVEQDLWGWGMHTAFRERAENPGGRRMALAVYMQEKTSLANQLQQIAKDLPTLAAADRFTLLGLLNEGIHGKGKLAERLLLVQFHQLVRQTLWTWMTQKALEERPRIKKRAAVKKKPVKAPAKKITKKKATGKVKKAMKKK